MENFKIKVNNAEESERAQKAFFALGGKWYCYGKTVINYNFKYLAFYSEGGLVKYGSDMDLFRESGNKEITLPELEKIAATHLLANSPEFQYGEPSDYEASPEQNQNQPCNHHAMTPQETKARFFGLYIGQKFTHPDFEEPQELRGVALYPMEFIGIYSGISSCFYKDGWVDIERCKLILKPLSDFTDALRVTDFLRSKGYCLPYMGSDPINQGWAILQTQAKTTTP